MPKSRLGAVAVGGSTFQANVTPDPFDARDLEYRPRLQPLDDVFDSRVGRHVMTQDGNSCTGHAVAAMVNEIFANKAQRNRVDPATTHVSPYMLYYLGRRYDEFEGEEDLGSSLRGVLKGWWRHGLCGETQWPKLDTHSDLDAPALADDCRKRPLGAFYRVNAHRLDDMQSAICELHGIVASALIHDGWREENVKEELCADGKKRFLIKKTASSQPIGGHAFAIVGYDEYGFLVQNSWGEAWGAKGFATLPYEDWLESAFDAWVARPGVPQTPFDRFERTAAEGFIGIAKAANLTELRKHVVNLGNDGRLSTNGKLTSSRAQLDGIIDAMRAKHQQWGHRDLVIFAHGGLVNEDGGIRIADKQFQWWLDNEVYPIFIAWQSGLNEIFIDMLADTAKKLPFGAGFGDFLIEQKDRLLENVAKRVSGVWGEMKENARAASRNVNTGGGAMLADLLGRYQQESQLPLRVHLVGHSTGAILHAELFLALQRAGVANVETLTYLAGAIRVDEFNSDVRPHIRSGAIRRFTNFTMNDEAELNDVCAAGKVTIYHKSLLYLVSRGFEKPSKFEEPLVGMQRFFDDDIAAHSIVAPHPNCTAAAHGAFDEDVPTMTEVMRRVRPGVAVLPFPSETTTAKVAAAAAAASPALTVDGRVRTPHETAMVGAPIVVAEAVVDSKRVEKRAKDRPKNLPKETRSRASKSKGK